MFPLRRSKIIKSSETARYQLMTLDSTFKGAVCSSIDEVIYLNEMNSKNFTLRISSEYLKAAQIVLLFRKNSFLVDVFNEKLSALKAGGLIDFWIANHMDPRHLKSEKLESGPSTVKLYQLSAIFIIWLVGCSVGLIAFILERLIACRNLPMAD
jgi:hypothetical protein